MNDSTSLRHFEKLLETPELPSPGPQPRSSREAITALDKKLDEGFAYPRTPQKNKNLIRSLVLLWHDHLDESHSISQDIHSVDGSFLHGIMHRREPDYSNAKYWFNRVSEHPAFPEIARRTTELLTTENPKLLKKLVPGGEWDPFAFVDACEQAVRRSPAEIPFLQRVQEIEFRVLLERFCE